MEQAKRFGALGECLLIGAGSIGLAVLTVLVREGVSSITVVDLARPRLDAALAAGATAVATTVDDLPVHAFDTSFDVVGVPATRRAAVAHTRHGGTVVAVGLGADEGSISWFDVVRREIALVGANTFTPDDFAVALGWLADGSVRAPAVSRTIPVEHGGAVFQGLAERTDDFVGKTFLAH
ncbi:zinc-binding dehydrogenase [Nakamurella sp. YIM 132084]|uniref:Zinc-binding dehydrogenase n=1 Tax=Nakamurella leprariae TaxID=2803911 RepID=A0A938YEI9_9ACTN|nr:zinc-binding dehydrogenase [Nakamurella leprariae]